MHLRACFVRARRMRCCCLDARVKTATVDGHVLLPMRTGAPLPAPPHSPTDLLALAVAVLEALAVMHANGMLHLDVKPHNILIGVSNSSAAAMLVDYDLAAHVDDVLDAMRDGPVPVGTPGYISPLLIGRMDPAYVRCCTSASASSAASARLFRVPVPRLDDVGWQDHFAAARHRVLASDMAAASLLPTVDLHSLAVTLHRLYSPSAAPTDLAGRKLIALIGGLVGGAFADAKRALRFLVPKP